MLFLVRIFYSAKKLIRLCINYLQWYFFTPKDKKEEWTRF